MLKINIMELTPEEIKKLRIFAKYCQTFGAKNIEISGSVDYGSSELDYINDAIYLSQGAIKLYPEIKILLEKILTEAVLPEYLEFTDNLYEEVYGGISLYFDFENRTIEANGYYYDREEEGSTDEFEVAEYADNTEKNQLFVLFTELKDAGYTSGEVSYSGGGDSGEINSDFDIIGPNGKKRTLDLTTGEFSFLYDYLYDCLSSSFGGWEINEGSSGTFELSFVDYTITIHHTNYYETTKDIDFDFQLKY